MNRRRWAFGALYLVALHAWNGLLSRYLRPVPATRSRPTLDPGATRVRVPNHDAAATATASRPPLPSLRASISSAASPVTVSAHSTATPSPLLQPLPSLPSPPPPQQLALRAASPSQCATVQPQTDLEGAVVVDGVGARGLSLEPARCCAKCLETRGCNVWVACSDAAACGEQCWLKWAATPLSAPIRGRGVGVPWTSGTLPFKDVPSLITRPSQVSLMATGGVSLQTEFGNLRIRLRPEWHLPSVDYVRWVGLADVCTTKCVFYRAEPNFLLQGAMRAVIAPNNQVKNIPTTPFFPYVATPFLPHVEKIMCVCSLDARTAERDADGARARGVGGRQQRAGLFHHDGQSEWVWGHAHGVGGSCR